MFYYLNGELVMLELNYAAIDCNGIAYKLLISANTYSRIASKKGEKVKLYTHLLVRDDAFELIGFYDLEELASFKMLISVSGVGPKSAISVLSLLSPANFALAVTTGDNKAISKAQGIGAKSAARIVLELKDKISKELTSESDSILDFGMAAPGNKMMNAQDALLVLGYTRSEALDILRGIDTQNLSLEEIVKAALKKAGGK